MQLLQALKRHWTWQGDFELEKTPENNQISSFFNSGYTMRIPNIDKIKADYVVACVAAAWIGLMQAIDVKARSEHSPDT